MVTPQWNRPTASAYEGVKRYTMTCRAVGQPVGWWRDQSFTARRNKRDITHKSDFFFFFLNSISLSTIKIIHSTECTDPLSPSSALTFTNVLLMAFLWLSHTHVRTHTHALTHTHTLTQSYPVTRPPPSPSCLELVYIVYKQKVPIQTRF